MEFFIHSSGTESSEIIEIEATAQVRTLLTDQEPDGHIWLEEVDEEVVLDRTIEAAGIRQHHHVHRGHCHRVKVTVRFNGVNLEHDFGPARTIKTVRT